MWGIISMLGLFMKLFCFSSDSTVNGNKLQAFLTNWLQRKMFSDLNFQASFKARLLLFSFVKGIFSQLQECTLIVVINIFQVNYRKISNIRHNHNNIIQATYTSHKHFLVGRGNTRMGGGGLYAGRLIYGTTFVPHEGAKEEWNNTVQLFC